MTTVSSTSSSSSTSTTSTTASSSSTSSLGDFTTMLTLLLKELQTQDPTSPMDTSTFTTQLVQMSSLEAQQASNTLLEGISSSLSSFTGSYPAYSYLGQTVSTDSDEAPLQDGSAIWSYTLPSDADSVSYTVSDSSGNVVYSGTGSTSAGTNYITWKGTETDGGTATSGTYTLSITATTDNAASSVSAYGVGKVTGVDTSTGTAKLTLGSYEIAMDDVTSIL
ncbi:flagellar hook assembly protein FlgD [Nitrospirillum amazonense]|uniref:Basal-body rod modification protein FlgD n=1 Tax=Nitrospirillum amazonense TaxID=28077 RepID=A0A560KGU9_9PROT|nr:flagellar hook capping FlgD N-terminal domain-containing protein [Nitrospirillum amazonense]MDG3443414.1 flagellar hook capping FlgD N-terminal domain-containing protein [Nitrospirillum amazonense]TWB82447.1 flagellar basal-body rod modification protein FlgD [Nitrospirillum amazonense]